MRVRFAVNVVVKLAPLAIAIFTGYVATTTAEKIAAYCGAGVLFVVGEYAAVYRPLKSLDEARKTVLDLVLRRWLNDATYNQRRVELRVNVMLTRWVFGKHFFQYYQLNMDGHPDANLHFSIKKGFCGRVFRDKTQRTKYRDLRKMTPDGQLREFGWKATDLAKCTHVKAIACAGIYKDRKTLLGAIKQDYFGVLNVDAIDDDGAEFLKDQKVLDRVTEMAKIVQATFPH